MNHQQWIESHAAERYLLEEMSPEERDAFEQHYFACSECSEDVESGVTFIESLQAADGKQRVVAFPAARSRVTAWISSVAASMLLFVVGYQNLVQIPRLASSRLPSFAVVPPPQELTAPTRGAEEGQAAELRPGVDRILVPIVPDAPAPQYEVQLRDAAGKVLGTARVTAQQAEQPVEFQLPPLPAGSYVVVAEGVREDGNRSEAGRYRFVVHK